MGHKHDDGCKAKLAVMPQLLAVRCGLLRFNCTRRQGSNINQVPFPKGLQFNSLLSIISNEVSFFPCGGGRGCLGLGFREGRGGG